MNPFYDFDGSFLVLGTDEEKHLLWPSAKAVPTGCQVVQADTGTQSGGAARGATPCGLADWPT